MVRRHSLRPERAVERLEQLRVEANNESLLSRWEDFTAWKGKVRGVIASSLGDDDNLVVRFDDIKYSLSMWTSSTPASAEVRKRAEGIREACGVIDAALYHLRLLIEEDEPIDLRSFDPDLWENVKNLVEDQDWAKVASQTAIFVEHQIREWAGDPKNRNGDSLFGTALMGKVFADDSDLRLGARQGEREGWRALANGFAQALSNVDRHKIQKREDAQRYAIGVLGFGSLILTQLRHEHSEIIEDVAIESSEALS